MFVDYEPSGSIVMDYVLSWMIIGGVIGCTCVAVKCAWHVEDREWRRAMANAEKCLLTKEEVCAHLKDFTMEVKSYTFQQKNDVPSRRQTDLSLTEKTDDSGSVKEEIGVDDDDDDKDTTLDDSDLSVSESTTQQPDTMVLPCAGVGLSRIVSQHCFHDEPHNVTFLSLNSAKLDGVVPQVKSVDHPLLSVKAQPIKEVESEQLCYNPSSHLLRNVPTECAVCLDGYNLGNRVTWSPNPMCPHVFHESCIVEWLASRKARPSDEEGPKKRLTCPCCRNPFLEQNGKMKDVVLIVEEEEGEEEQRREEEAVSAEVQWRAEELSAAEEMERGAGIPARAA